MNNETQFYNIPADIFKLQFSSNEKEQKLHKIYCYIIANYNKEKEFNGLKKNECYLSFSILADDTNISISTVKRLVKEMVENGDITYVYKSNSKCERSKIYCNFIANLDYEIK
ncbi:MAG: winged helix-turn-helix transcriptional regulator [Bacilli bacterium]|nr:winged helix-turn-helix transcriptional regulator [Bacilli bacterium]